MEYYIRPVRLSDAEDVNAIRREPETARFMLASPSERLDRTEDFIRKLDGNSHEFVAVTKLPGGGEKVVGISGVHVEQNPRLRHCASFGICVAAEYQNMGVGSALIEAVLDLCDNWLRIVRLELGVYAGNDRALHLYEKYGFEKEGVKRKAAVQDGEYVDEIIMSRIRHAD